MKISLYMNTNLGIQVHTINRTKSGAPIGTIRIIGGGIPITDQDILMVVIGGIMHPISIVADPVPLLISSY